MDDAGVVMSGFENPGRNRAGVGFSDRFVLVGVPLPA